MVIKINYTSSDIYVSTNVSPVYVVVNYSGVGGTTNAVWGSITGTLSDQTDLQTALDAKFDDPTGTTAQYLRGDGSLATFPTIPSGTVTSVGLTMPSAFNVANSPITSAGTLAVTGAGLATQYIRGDGQLATFPSTASGGSSVNYYLNGSVNASVAGYKQLANTATIGGGTDFTLVGNGLIAQFLTDVGNPNRVEIPGGSWNFEMFFQVSSSGGNQKFYVELLKYNGTTFTSIASSSAVPEEITGGTSIDLYLTSLAVPTTALLVTDRLAIRVYIVDNAVGRTVTLHTEDNTLCEIITTFSGGIAALNGLTANTQYLATGTSGTDFNISSLTDTHTFNLPTASATNRGALSTTDWSTFNAKVPSTRTLTINGTAYDLSADRSWTVSATATPAGSNTQIQYNNSGVFGASANLVWDNTNGRFGIGTASPVTQFNVNQTAGSVKGILISGDEFYQTGNGATNKGVRIALGVSRISNRQIWMGDNDSFGSSTLSLFRYQTGIVGYASIDAIAGDGSRLTTIIGTDTSKVGVGYNNGSGVNIAGYTAKLNVFTSEIDSTTNLLIKKNDNASGLYINVQDTSGAGKLVLTNAGRLLLGLTAESTYLLDVNGTARVSGDALVEKNQNAATNITISNTTSGASSSSSLTAATGSTNGITIGKYSSTTSTFKIINANDGYIYNGQLGDIAIFNDNASGKIKFAAGGTSTAQMTLTSAGRLLLGTTSESTYLLDVNSSVRFGSNFIWNNSDGRLDINGAAKINGVIITGNPTVPSGTGASLTEGYFAAGGYAFFQGYNYTTSAYIPVYIDGLVTYINPNSGGNVGINTSTNVPSAQLHISSTTKGFLPPRMTTTEKNAIGTPAAGLQVYDTTLGSLNVYNGTSWVALGAGGGGGMAIGGAITSATAGSVLFATTGGVLGQNNANFFWDNTNSRLGIGTTTPTKKLEVVGSDILVNTLTIGRGGGNFQTSVAFGFEALNAVATGDGNVAIGYRALKSNTSAYLNTAVGGAALSSNTTGVFNTAIGGEALQSATTANSNTIIGARAAKFLTTATGIVAIGQSAFQNCNSSTNIIIGTEGALGWTGTTSNDNVLIGNQSGNFSSGYSKTTLIGQRALSVTSTGNNNIGIGFEAGANNTTGSNNIFIGVSINPVAGTDSNRTFIGNASTTSTWLGGNLLLGSTTSTGQRLQVTGDSKLSGRVNFTPQATPGTPASGDVYYDSTTNKLRCYDGTIWNDLF